MIFVKNNLSFPVERFLPTFSYLSNFPTLFLLEQKYFSYNFVASRGLSTRKREFSTVKKKENGKDGSILDEDPAEWICKLTLTPR